MPAAAGTDPELIGPPGSPRRGVSEVHLFAAALTPDVQIDVCHGSILAQSIIRNPEACRISGSMIPGIILAAGKSSRMGRPKALLPIGSAGATFLERIIQVLLDGGVEDVVAVLGADASLIRCETPLDAVRARLVENPGYERGQLSSLLAGLRAVDRPGVRAILVTLVDVPLVSASTVGAVLRAYAAGGGARIVRPTRHGRFGHPVIFDRTLFDELRHAGAGGAKDVIRAHPDEVRSVEVPDEGAFLSIETPEDYARHLGPFPGPLAGT
jgi:molybdenum cofactor cytidylyltransferase